MHTAQVNGVPVRTKKALREALRERPQDVTIMDGSLPPFRAYSGPVTTMPEGAVVYIVGPDARERKWYANLERLGSELRLDKR